MAKRPVTYYDILNVPPTAGDDDVRRAWHDMARRWHPDRNPENRARAEHMLKLANRAYRILRTAPQRRAYNSLLLKKLRGPAMAAPSKRKATLLSVLAEVFWPLAPARKEALNG